LIDLEDNNEPGYGATHREWEFDLSLQAQLPQRSSPSREASPRHSARLWRLRAVAPRHLIRGKGGDWKTEPFV